MSWADRIARDRLSDHAGGNIAEAGRRTNKPIDRRGEPTEHAYPARGRYTRYAPCHPLPLPDSSQKRL